MVMISFSPQKLIATSYTNGQGKHISKGFNKTDVLSRAYGRVCRHKILTIDFISV